MKRNLTGKIKIIGCYPVAGGECLYVLPFEMSIVWAERKGADSIAICWRGKLHFRQLYYRKDGFVFKFFNHVFYLSEMYASRNLHINV